MLDNRKPGELPELNNKMVKVSPPEDTETQSLILTFAVRPTPKCAYVYFRRAQSGWCSMTAGCSIQSTSSWRDGSGIVLVTVSLTSVMAQGTILPIHLFYEKTNEIIITGQTYLSY